MQLLLSKYKDYLQSEKKLSQYTIVAYSHNVAEFIVFVEKQGDKSMSVEAISLDHLRQFMVSCAEQKLQNKTINRKLAAIKSFFTYLYKINEITTNPFAKQKGLKVPKLVQMPFSETEIENVVANFESIPNTFDTVRDQLIILLFYTAGLRKSELIHLRVSDIDWYNKQIKVLGKGSKHRIVPIIEKLEEVLGNYQYLRRQLEVQLEPEMLILTQKGKKVSQSFVYRLIKKYFSTSTKQVVSPHVLRHSFASHLLDNGAAINAVKDLLGHSSLSSTQIYTNSSISALKRAVVVAHPRNKKQP